MTNNPNRHCERSAAVQTKRAISTTAWMASLTLAMTMLLSLPARSDEYQTCRQSLTEWNTCSTDDDCAIIPDLCGSMTGATNTAHQQEAEACNLKLKALVKCAAIAEPQDLPPMKALCIKGICKAKVAQP